MRFGEFGSFVQIEPGSDGYVLWLAGLITRREDWQVEIEPTPLLRSLFTGMPEMEELYPVLVEYVLIFRYPDLPGFVDDREISRRLVGLGMTDDGLLTLSELVEDAARRG
jgi:hypothetical protein